ncbi:MAG: hypothetical protein KKE20_02615 [Nanoarchaeota archaeon]|nr:hypothetical protein [Nanoarchaeota archaeon]
MKKNKRLGNSGKHNVSSKESGYAWAAIILALFFWVPIFNVFLFLPASLYCGVTAIRNVRRDPEKHEGMALSIVAVVFASISFVYALIVLILTSTGRIII